MATYTQFFVQSLRDSGWADVSLAYDTVGKAEDHAMRLIDADPPGHWDGKLRIVSRTITETVEWRVRTTL